MEDNKIMETENTDQGAAEMAQNAPGAGAGTDTEQARRRAQHELYAHLQPAH